MIDSGFLKDILIPGCLVYEIGACMGETTQNFLDWGVGRVVACEPEAKDYRYLAQRFEGKPVTVVSAAVGSEAGFQTLHINDGARSCSTLVPDECWGLTSMFFPEMRADYTEEVRVTTLDDLIATYGTPHLIHIDVARYEGRVIKGLSQAIPWIVFEFTYTSLVNGQTMAAVDHLYGLDSSTRFNATYPGMYYTDGDGTKHVQDYAFDGWMTRCGLLSCLFARDHRAFWGRIVARKGSG